jgi:plastocyanin
MDERFLRRLALLMGAAALALLLFSAVFAAGETLTRTAVTGAGGLVINSSVSLYSAVAQPVAGSVDAAGLALCSGVNCPQPQSTLEPGELVTVEVHSNFFTPDPITVTVGSVVKWDHIEGFHNVAADDGSFTSGLPDSSWPSFEHTFATAGRFPYHCDVHREFGMVGTVIVVGGPEPIGDVLIPALFR